MNYNLADFVKFPKGNGTAIGRIEDFNREEDWFEYFEYFTAEELGPQPHHGKNEVFKTDQLRRAPLTTIIGKVNLMKTSQYILSDRSGYIMRQEYIAKELRPQLKPCICGQLVNPDHVLTACPDCEKIFHTECLQRRITEGNSYCDQCRSELKQLNHLKAETVQTQIPNQTKTVIPIIDDDEEEFIEFKSNDKKIDLEILAKKTKKNDGGVVKINITQPQEIPSSKPKEQHKVIQPFKNIQQNQIDKMNTWVSKYRQQESNLSSFEKKRQEVREKFFRVIFYGVEELRSLELHEMHDKEREYMGMSDSQLFQAIKNLALDIEVLLHLKFNTRDKLETAYIDRCKLIYMHMKDDKNIELRRKVLSKEFLPMDLCTRDESDLYNPERRKQTQQIAKRVIELNQKEIGVPNNNQIDFDEITFSKQPSNNDEPKKQKEIQISRAQQLKERMNEYLIQKSLIRFKQRIIDELNEKEQKIMLSHLDQTEQQIQQQQQQQKQQQQQ